MSDILDKVKQKIFYLFLTLLSISLYSAEIKYQFGEEGRGKSTYSNIEQKIGQQGFVNLSLKTDQYEATSKTSLLLPFNAPNEASQYSYETVQDCIIGADASGFGGKVGIFSAINPSLILRPSKSGIQVKGFGIRDFSIEFRINPDSLTEREVLYEWSNVFLKDNEIYQQEVSCVIENRKIYWRFINFFGTSKRTPDVYQFESLSELVPGKWSNQLVTFNSNNGTLTYLFDGKIEGIQYITTTRTQLGEILYPALQFAKNTKIEIGRQFSGKFDEFRIERSYIDKPKLHLFSENRGVILTETFDLGYTNSTVEAITANSIIVSNSDVFYYYRMTDNRKKMLLWKEEVARDYRNGEIAKEWVPFIPSQWDFDRIEGRYIQLLVELYANGDGNQSSLLKDVTIFYTQDEPPIPPRRVIASPKDGAVELRWEAVSDSDLAGYLVYWGDSSGYYYGNDNGKSSPVDVGKKNFCRIDNLVNGKLYFFSIVAYDNIYGNSTDDENHKSKFSVEVSTRPSRIYAGATD